MGLFFNRKKKENKYPEGTNVRITVDYPEQHAAIIVDSFRIMNQTTNPDTYFSRYKLASNKACHIMGYKPAIYNGMTAEDIYYFLSEKKDRLHVEFIERVFDAGKENLFVYQMREIGLSMSREVRDYLVNRFGDKKFHFCRVSFNDRSSRTYTYVAKDKTISVGDTVTILAGNGFVKEEKIMQVVGIFDGSLKQLDFSIENLRCVERKLKSIICPSCGASIEVYENGKVGRCKYCGAEFNFMSDSTSSVSSKQMESANVQKSENAQQYVSKKTNDWFIKGIDDSNRPISKNHLIVEAKDYIISQAFSREGLKWQLMHDGMSDEDATYAVNNCDVDWLKQTGRAIKEYINCDAFSKNGIIDILREEGYEDNDIAESINVCEIDWNEQAVRMAKSYIRVGTYSKKEMVELLVDEGFTPDESNYGAENCGIDYMKMALQSAKETLNCGDYYKEEIIEVLLDEGYTEEEIRYAIKEMNI